MQPNNMIIIWLAVIVIIMYSALFYAIKKDYINPSQDLRDGVHILSPMLISFSLLISAYEFYKKIEVEKANTELKFAQISTSMYKFITQIFIDNSDLDQLYYSIYGTLGYPYQVSTEKTSNIDSRKKEFYVVSYIINTFEDAYYNLDLMYNSKKSKYNGIINTFKLWFSSDKVIEIWKTVKDNYSPEFIHFIEREILNDKYLSSKVYIIQK